MLESLLTVIGAALLAIGFFIGRRLSHPDARVEKIAADIADHRLKLVDLEASLHIIDEYLRRQERLKAAKETETLGKLSSEVRKHLGMAPVQDEPDPDDTVVPSFKVGNL